MAETDKLKLPKITGNMAWDVVRDLNALAEAVDVIAGKPDGIAVLDADGKLPAEQLGIDSGDIASKEEINKIKGDVGDKDQLSTENKTSVVDAVNEIEQKRESLELEVTSHLAETVQQEGGVHGLIYEEGEFTPYYTPALGQFDNIEYSAQEGYYARVGNEVFITLNVTTSDVVLGTASNVLYVSGLPFVEKENTHIGFSLNNIDRFDVAKNINQVELFGNRIFFSEGTTQGRDSLRVNELKEGSEVSQNRVRLSGTYII